MSMTRLGAICFINSCSCFTMASPSSDLPIISWKEPVEGQLGVVINVGT